MWLIAKVSVTALTLLVPNTTASATANTANDSKQFWCAAKARAPKPVN